MARMRRYLVTGGCGFIGSHLVDALLRIGHQVRVLDNLSTGIRENLAPEAELFVGDVRDAAAVRRAIDGVDGCFHLAAVASVVKSREDWAGTHSVNLTGTINVFEQASKARNGSPIPVVYASSAAVYGNCAARPLGEEIPVRPINAYGADKASCELHAHIATHLHGVPATGLRFFNVYGTRQLASSIYSGVVSIFCERLSKNRPVDIYGDGQQTRDLIHVSDVVACLQIAMANPPKEAAVFNVCTGRSVSVIELAETIAELCGVPLRIRHQAARDCDIRHSVGDPERAAAQLGYRTRVELRDGLDDLLHSLVAVAPVVRDMRRMRSGLMRHAV